MNGFAEEKMSNKELQQLEQQVNEAQKELDKSSALFGRGKLPAREFDKVWDRYIDLREQLKSYRLMARASGGVEDDKEKYVK